MIISEAYRKQNQELHERNEHYGTSGAKWRGMVRPLARWGRAAILDFGCGKQTLSKALGPAYRVTDYDPCIPGLDTPPVPHPVVVCGDVLEHVEPELLPHVLKELRRVTEEVGFFVINLGPSKKTLADGRNAHLIQKPVDWWEEKILAAGFTIEKQDHNEREVWFIVRPKLKCSPCSSAGTVGRRRRGKSQDRAC